jgi:hypothetical protein
MITNTPPPAASPQGNFIALLQGKTGGVTLPQLDAELAELIQTVQTTGRAGTLTYKVKIIPNAKKGVRVEDTVDVKRPKEEVGVSFFFVGPGGSLLRNDPNQTELNLRVVTDTPEPLKTAAQ